MVHVFLPIFVSAIANLTITIQPLDDEPYMLILYNHNEQVVYRRDDSAIIVEENIAIENREMELFGSKSIALIVLFDPDEETDESFMDVILQVLNEETGEYEGE